VTFGDRKARLKLDTVTVESLTRLAMAKFKLTCDKAKIRFRDDEDIDICDDEDLQMLQCSKITLIVDEQETDEMVNAKQNMIEMEKMMKAKLEEMQKMMQASGSVTGGGAGLINIGQCVVESERYVSCRMASLTEAHKVNTHGTHITATSC